MVGALAWTAPAQGDSFGGNALELAAIAPVAAYSFDQASGATLNDLSGNDNNGAITAGTWTAGRFGNALSLNGTSSVVTVPDSSTLDLTTGMTLEAWIRPNSLAGDWRTAILKERPGGLAYALYAHDPGSGNRPSAEVNVGPTGILPGTSALPLGVWTHLATTYDGATQRLFVNGAQVSQRNQTGVITTTSNPLKLGGNSVWGEYLNGLIDEIRIYDRALTATEIQGDMNQPVGAQDDQAPTVPGNLTATGSLTNAQLSWTPSTDNVGVSRYSVHRATTAGFTPSEANRVTYTTGTSHTDTPPPGTYFYKVIAEDAAGNASAPSNEAQATSGDLVAPTTPGTLTAIGSIGRATLTWGAATDNVGVVRYNVHRSTTAGFTPGAANRIAQPATASYVDATAAGTYFYKVTAEDAAGNVGPASNEASATVTVDTQPPSTPAGLTATTAGTAINLSWTASADNVGVLRYNLHRSQTSGFTPSAANRIAQPTSPSHSDGGLNSGTYFYKVTAEDAAGNVSGVSNQASATITVTAPTGLVAAYGFDEGSGTTTVDGSGNGNTGSLASTLWSTGGRFGGALSFNGNSSRVNIADSASLRLTTGMTLEAWVRPSALADWATVIIKERTGWYAGALYATTDNGRPSGHVYTTGDRELRGPSGIPVGAWTHLATTYNGSSLALYVNGTQVASSPATGAIIANIGALRIGGNSIWYEPFNGLIDEVRIYSRALSASEIQEDMERSVAVDTTAPTVTARTPANGAAGVHVGTAATATFSEGIRASTLNAGTFVLRDGSDLVPATVSYDAATRVATLRPDTALRYGATYQATIDGGPGGVTDLAGNPLASDVNWSFSTEASPPQVLVLSSASNRYGAYLAEILRAEGLNAFTTLDVSLISPALLSSFDVVLLGQTPVTPGQVATLSGWVNAGGNLIAMRPDKQLAGLLGLFDAGTTLSDAYLRVDTSSQPGTGIVGSTIQYHGTADRYTLNGARAVATLHSNATTATTNPAVTLRSVGSAGGEAAAFTYDFARSVVYTRQGNPAWAGQERDGVIGIRPDDMFFGGAQTDWLDTNRIAIPQADEQQRLLVNLITLMERDRLPVPRFWYLPRGEKAAVVMSGDDHSPQSPGGTQSHFERYKTLSPAGCNVARWECVRATSYMYPSATLTNTQAVGYIAEGFEVALHPVLGSCPTTSMDPEDIAAVFDNQMQQFAARYPGVPAPATNRNHCVYWPDWASMAKIQLARGMRMDANYYHFPAGWIGARPGFLNGGGFPMRFADLDGSQIDVYQLNTNITDESGQAYGPTIDALLDGALGPNGYYGAFGANMHTDYSAPHPGAEAIVASARSRDVPVVSYKQMLDWTDGRNGSTIRSMAWDNGVFTFTTTVGAGANGLQTVLPTRGPTGTLSALSCGGSPRAYTVQTIKGVQYAMFDAVTGNCRATYS